MKKERFLLVRLTANDEEAMNVMREIRDDFGSSVTMYPTKDADRMRKIDRMMRRLSEGNIPGEDEV